VLYQTLSHRFVLRSDDCELQRLAADLIGDFAHPIPAAEPRAPTVYALQGARGRPRYTLCSGDRQVASTDDAAALMRHLLWQISTDTAELAEGYLLVHSGAVVSPAGDGVLILGESGSGKTTLVAALVQDGFGYLSDEAAALDLETGLVHPWPRPLGFRRGSRSLHRFAQLFAADGEDTEEAHVAIEQIRPGAIATPCRVRQVIDHRYEPGAPTRLEALSRAGALVRMGSAAPRLRREGTRGLAMLAEVVRGARAHTLLSGDLEQALRAVREL
jgi:hypothetical protein